MKSLKQIFSFLLLVIIFTACQKELNFDPTSPAGNAVGTLQSTTGNCLPKTVNGTYKKNQTLTSTNYVEVTANITSVGNYIIKSDTIAGFSFIGIGIVTATGTNTIKLIGEGTPDSIGTKTFTIKFGTSVCKLDVVVTAASSGPTAVFSITSCGSPVLSGPVYSVGTPTTAFNTVMLNVNITSMGLYSVTSTSNNGLTFSASGAYNGIGSNTIIFTPTGTPVSAGTFQYTVNTGTSTCIFSITVTAAPPPPVVNLDYIPQTDFSNWTRQLVGGTAADTTYMQVSTNSKTFGANTYKIFEIKVNGVPTDSVYNRKNGGLYYQYFDGDLGVLDNPINKEYLVLDSTKNIGGMWVSPNLGPNSAGGGTVVVTSIIITSTLTSKGTTETIQGNTYTNVIKVTYNYVATVFGLPTPVADEERWFAKGKGVIYSKVTNLINPGPAIETETKRVQIF